MPFKSLKRYTLLKRTLLFIAAAGIYFLLGFYGLELATINNNASPIWPASGFAAGVLIIFGRWLFPAIFLGSFAVNMSAATPLLPAFSVAAGNMIEAFIAATFVCRILNKNIVKNYAELLSIFFGALIASAFSATIGISSLVLTKTIPESTFSYAWFTWWSGNSIGILIVLPLFTEFLNETRQKFPSIKNLLIGLLTAIVITTAIAMVFVKDYNQSFAWSAGPLLIYAGLKAGRVFSRILLILISLLIIFLTAAGYGPFEHGDLNLNLIYVQTLLISYAFCILFVKPLVTTFKPGKKFLLGVVLSWITMFVVVFAVTKYEKQHSVDDFNKNCDMAMQLIARTGVRYESLINGYSALFKIKNTPMNAFDWKVFSDNLRLSRNYDAVYGVGFARYVEADDLEAFLKKNKLSLITVDQDVPINFDHHFVIEFMEPAAKNLQAVGLDVGSDEPRRQTIRRTIDTESVAATGMVFLLQDTKKRRGFVLMKAARDIQNKVQGIIVAPVVNEVFFGKTFSQFSHLVNMKISSDGIPIHSSTNNLTEEFKKNSYYQKRTINLFGNTYQFEFTPSQEFFARHAGSSATLALLISVLMLFIAAFLLEQLTFSQKAGVLIEQRTRELEESKMQLINSSKMASLGEMASGMAHEINNPLAIIQGKVKVISMMLEDLQINHPTLFQEIHKIKLTTDRIEKIVKGLRNFSRASTNDPFEMVPLPRIINETLDLCLEKFRSEGINVMVKDIPDVAIMCRPSQISQVLINLLNNSSDAIEHLDKKWIEISFKLKEKNQISIFLTDSGYGISPEVAERIMEPFFTTKEVRKGTGLGLSIAKSIIDSHGGVLWLDTSHSHTRFVINLEARPILPDSAPVT